jgi:hypothetical protein
MVEVRRKHRRLPKGDGHGLGLSHHSQQRRPPPPEEIEAGTRRQTRDSKAQATGRLLKIFEREGHLLVR